MAVCSIWCTRATRSTNWQWPKSLQGTWWASSATRRKSPIRPSPIWRCVHFSSYPHVVLASASIRRWKELWAERADKGVSSAWEGSTNIYLFFINVVFWGATLWAGDVPTIGQSGCAPYQRARSQSRHVYPQPAPRFAAHLRYHQGKALIHAFSQSRL